MGPCSIGWTENCTTQAQAQAECVIIVHIVACNSIQQSSNRGLASSQQAFRAQEKTPGFLGSVSLTHFKLLYWPIFVYRLWRAIVNQWKEKTLKDDKRATSSWSLVRTYSPPLFFLSRTWVRNWYPSYGWWAPLSKSSISSWSDSHSHWPVNS